MEQKRCHFSPEEKATLQGEPVGISTVLSAVKACSFSHLHQRNRRWLYTK